MMKNIKMIVDIEKHMADNNINEQSNVKTLINSLKNPVLLENIEEHISSNELNEGNSIEVLIESIVSEDLKTLVKS